LAQTTEAFAEVRRDDGDAGGAVALEAAKQGEKLAEVLLRDAAPPSVQLDDDGGNGGDAFDDCLEGFLLGGVGNLLETVIERDETTPLRDGAIGIATEMGAEGVRLRALIGGHDQPGLSVEGDDGIGA